MITILVPGFPGICFSADPPVIEQETIAGQISSANGFRWHYGYDIRFQDKQIQVQVAINLVPGKGVNKAHLDRVKKDWEKTIEKVWSRAVFIQSQTGQQYPVVVDVLFNGTKFHHDVIVRNHGSGCCTNELNWYILDSPVSIAHEFGHMLGNYDEYAKGALDPATGIIDPTSIMTRNPQQGIAFPRHFLKVLDWFNKKTLSDHMRVLKIDQKSNS